MRKQAKKPAKPARKREHMVTADLGMSHYKRLMSVTAELEKRSGNIRRLTVTESIRRIIDMAAIALELPITEGK